jgi:hypothetical protein
LVFWFVLKNSIYFTGWISLVCFLKYFNNYFNFFQDPRVIFWHGQKFRMPYFFSLS